MKVVLHRITSTEVSTIVAELKSLGYRVGQDFDFAYTPGRYDDATMTQHDRYTIFTFYNASLASWFALKWS